MMRGRHSWGVAVRRPSGDIARVAYPLPPAGSRNRFWRFPVVRGVVALYESHEPRHQGPRPLRQHRPGGALRDAKPRRQRRRARAAAARRRGRPRQRGGSRRTAACVRVEATGGDRGHRAGDGRRPLHRGAAGGGQAVRVDPSPTRSCSTWSKGSSGSPSSSCTCVADQPDPRSAQGLRVPRRRAQGHPRLRGVWAAGRRVRPAASPPGIRAAAPASSCWCSCLGRLPVRVRGQAERALAGPLAHHRHPDHRRDRLRDRHQVGRTIANGFVRPHPPLAGHPAAAAHHAGASHGPTARSPRPRSKRS